MPLPALRPLVLATALAAASTSALALGGIADINVIDRSTGQVLPVYTHQGRHYVAGRPGARYAVRVYNQAGSRIMAVMSVDGINVVSGDNASWDQNGYVFSPWQRHDVAGWRKSQAQVAAFEFTALPNSYAARTGRPDNVGVIGVALFRERALPVPPVPSPAPRPYDGAHGAGGAGGAGGSGRDSAAKSEAGSQRAGRSAESADRASADASARQAPAAEPAARKSLGSSNDYAAGSGASSSSATTASDARALSRPAPQPDAKLGTGHGARENAWVNYTEFERTRSTPDEIITIYYDSRANLVAQGVIPAPRVYPAPQPFPVLPQIGFVPDPPRM